MCPGDTSHREAFKVTEGACPALPPAPRMVSGQPMNEMLGSKRKEVTREAEGRRLRFSRLVAFIPSGDRMTPGRKQVRDEPQGSGQWQSHKLTVQERVQNGSRHRSSFSSAPGLGEWDGGSGLL